MIHFTVLKFGLRFVFNFFNVFINILFVFRYKIKSYNFIFKKEKYSNGRPTFELRLIDINLQLG
jgi:hypothetical protein